MKQIFILFAFALLFAACENEEDNIPEEMNLQPVVKANSEAGHFSVELMAKETLFQGYNKLYLDIRKSSGNSRVTQASVKLLPLMHMTTMTHAAPVENPPASASDEGYFEGAVVFIMPSNPDEGWTLEVAIDAEGQKDTVDLTIPEVKSLEEAREFNVMSEATGKTYFVSLVEPSAPKVGLNEIEFTVHYRENMLSFPAAEDLSIAIEPEMPSMNHGSPNNVNPVHTGNGHYKGKVNFTMTGWWRVNIDLSQGGQAIGENLSFDITF
jgi:hypothetical protein